MNNAERITALEGLLARIQKNAAVPRSELTLAVVKSPSVKLQATPAIVTTPKLVPAGVLAPGAGRYGEPTERAVVSHNLSKTDPGMVAAAFALEATAALEEMDDPLAFDFGGEPTVMMPMPKLPPVLKAPTITAPLKAPTITAPLKAPVVAAPLNVPIAPPPALLPPVLADDIDLAFEDEETRESPIAAAARIEAETEHLAAAKSKAEAERLAAEKAEADRRAEEWRLLEEEAVHLEAEQSARDEAEALAQEAEAKAEAARIATAAAEKVNAERLAREAAEASRLAKIAAAQAEAEKAKAERLAQEAAARAEAKAQQLAKEIAEKAEAERVAAASAAKAEAERVAAAAAKAEADRVAAAAEAERLATEAAAKAEAERLAAEEQRLAKETAERREREAAAQAEAELEASRRAEAELQAQAEAQQLAEEQAAAAKLLPVDEAPPVSARQPRDASRFDDRLVRDEDEAPPASGQVQSQRQPTIHDEFTVPAVAVLADEWGEEETFAASSVILAAQAEEELRIAGELPITPVDEPTVRTTAIRSLSPVPSRLLELRLAVEPPPLPLIPIDASPVVVNVAAEITSRPATAADAQSFLGAVRAQSPASFGALLDESLALGR